MGFKVFFDNQIFSTQKAGGISRYFSELIRNLPSYGFHPCKTKYFSNNIFYENKFSILPGDFRVRGRERLQLSYNNLIDSWNLKFNKYDIIHPTYYYPSFDLKHLKAKKIITVYDMIHEFFPDYFYDSAKLSLNKRNLVREADIVLAISKKTKNDLVDLFGVPESKVFVTYLASSLNPLMISKEIKLPEKFVLFVGGRENYKSFRDFVKNASSILQLSEIPVICVGGGAFTAEEQRMFRALNIETLFKQINLTDEQLAFAYKSATLFVFPSQYEGFGIPIIEAMSFQTPILLSDKSCFPEIADEAAHYFSSFEDIPEILEKLLLDKAFRDSKKKIQAQRLKDFSWKLTAEATSRAYEALVK